MVNHEFSLEPQLKNSIFINEPVVACAPLKNQNTASKLRRVTSPQDEINDAVKSTIHFFCYE